MKIKKLNNYKTDENTYIVYDENTKNGIVIDPGYKASGILKSADEDGINIQYIFLTHCHYDHIEFAQELKDNTNAKIVTGKFGGINIGDPDINLSLYGLKKSISIKADIILSDNEEFIIDGLKIKCIYTPGHTNCSVCYICSNHVFSGDTLFLRNIGRWDLPTGNEDTIIKSIKERLYTLDEDMTVHSGHGEDSTIGYEKKFNLYVKGE